MEYEMNILDDNIRNNLPGNIIELSDGSTYYELDGPEEGEIVVFIHGFSIPSYCWNPTFEFLKNKGFRVLRYDLFGRGYSDRPAITYNADLFDRQLLELLNSLKLTTKKINIIGLSMGGLITINFVDRHPELVNKISLEDPAGFSNTETNFPKVLKIPILGKMMFKRIGIDRLVERLPVNLYKGEENEKFPKYKELFLEQLKYKGYGQAILSTMINMPMNISDDVYKRVGEMNIPFQLFWGEFDKVLQQPSQELLHTLLPKVKLQIIKNAGHTCNYEQPDSYNPLLLEFLKGN